MANWSTTPGTNASVTAGISYDVSDLYVTIAPISGDYSITPQNFVIGGATPDGNTWTGGNVSDVVQSVTFSQDGANVLATIACNSHVFDVDTTIRIDIDESLVYPVEKTAVGVCADVQYPDETINVTQVITTDATATSVIDGDASTPWVKNYKHLENNIEGLLVFRMVLTPDTGYSIVNPDLEYTASVSGGEAGFTHGISNTTTGGGKIFSIYYTQPEGGGYYEPCNFGNLFTITYTEQLDSVDSTNTIFSVSTDMLIDYTGGESLVIVHGTAGAQYTMTIQQAASPNHTYDFDTNAITSTSTSYSGIIGADGTEVVKVTYAGSAVNVIYDIIIASAADSELHDDVPDAAGEMQVNQYGSNTLTISPTTAETGHFGTLPSNLLVVRPIRYDGDHYPDNEVNIFNISGITNGSSTRVSVIDLTDIRNLISGMVITGDNIPHGVTIVAVERDYIILSEAVSLTSATRLSCASRGANLVPFSFTIPPFSGQTLTVDTANRHEDSVWGFKNITTKVDTGQFSNTNLEVVDSRGVLPGMAVKGEGISANTFVSAIDYKEHAVTLNQAHSGVVDGARIAFRGANNTKCRAMNIDASIVGVNAVISGHLVVPRLDNDNKAIIFLDDILNSV